MEKTARERLLEAGVELLGTVGARYATARATEDAAGLPHGSMRHHFDNQRGFLLALTGHLLNTDSPGPDESPREMVQRWLSADVVSTRARFELTLLGTRDEEVGALIMDRCDRDVRALVETGASIAVARLVVGALDGVALDGLLHRDSGADLGPLLQLLEPGLAVPFITDGAVR